MKSYLASTRLCRRDSGAGSMKNLCENWPRRRRVSNLKKKPRIRFKGVLMSIKVHIPTPMRQHTEGQAVVDSVVGSTVQDLLENLGKKFPGIHGRIFDNGQVRRFVNVYINDEDVR